MERVSRARIAMNLDERMPEKLGAGDSLRWRLSSEAEVHPMQHLTVSVEAATGFGLSLAQT